MPLGRRGSYRAAPPVSPAPLLTHTPLPPCEILRLYVWSVYLTGRGVYMHTPLPVRYAIPIRRYTVCIVQGERWLNTETDPPFTLDTPHEHTACLTQGKAFPFLVRIAVGACLSGVCLCKGEAKTRTRLVRHTKHMGDYCRGLTARSTLRMHTFSAPMSAGTQTTPDNNHKLPIQNIR